LGFVLDHGRRIEDASQQYEIGKLSNLCCISKSPTNKSVDHIRVESWSLSLIGTLGLLRVLYSPCFCCLQRWSSSGYAFAWVLFVGTWSASQLVFSCLVLVPISLFACLLISFCLPHRTLNLFAGCNIHVEFFFFFLNLFRACILEN